MMQAEQPDVELLRKHVEELGEHFDTVHIFVTRHDPAVDGGTVNANWSSGNWFARYGQIRTWMIKEDEETKVRVRNDSLLEND